MPDTSRKLLSIIGARDNENKSPQMEEGQTSSSVASPSLQNYTNLPYYLQHCLKYCYVSPRITGYQRKMEEDNLIDACSQSDSSTPHSGRHVTVFSDMTTATPLLNNVLQRSLLFLGGQDLSSDSGNWLNFDCAKYLQVPRLIYYQME